MDIDGTYEDLLKAIGDIISREESLPMVDDITRTDLIKKTYGILTDTVCDAKITMHLHEPFNSMGYISIEGKNYSINNPKLFALICKSASNIEIYPQTDGKVVTNIAFHGISKKLRGGESS